MKSLQESLAEVSMIIGKKNPAGNSCGIKFKKVKLKSSPGAARHPLREGDILICGCFRIEVRPAGSPVGSAEGAFISNRCKKRIESCKISAV